MACADFSLKLAHSIKSAPPSDGPFTRNADYRLSARVVIGWDTPLHRWYYLFFLRLLRPFFVFFIRRFGKKQFLFVRSIGKLIDTAVRPTEILSGPWKCDRTSLEQPPSSAIFRCSYIRKKRKKKDGEKRE